MMQLGSRVSSLPLMNRWALLCVLAFWAVSAEAATYYVRTGGDDSHSCGQAQTDTNANAKASIQAGVNCVTGPGDTVVVHAGTYGAYGVSMLTPSVSGSNLAAGAITVRAATGETVWLQGGWSMWEATGQYWIIDGINVDAGHGGGVDFNAVLLTSNVRFMNAEVKDTRHIGIMTADSGTTEILNIRSHGHGRGDNAWCAPSSGGGQCHGLYMHPGGSALVRDSEFYDNNGQGIAIVYGAGDMTITGNRIHDNDISGVQWIGVGGNHLFSNNLVYRNGGSGVYLGNSGAVAFYNNTFYGNGDQGINGSSNNVTIRNNIFYNNTGTFDLPGSNNQDSHNVTSNPNFADAGAGNFHVQAGSPAINTGVTVSGVTTDFEKTPRPQGGQFDIGAYEYTASAPRLVSAPANLRRAGQ